MDIFRVQIGGWSFIRAWAFIRDFKVSLKCTICTAKNELAHLQVGPSYTNNFVH